MRELKAFPETKAKLEVSSAGLITSEANFVEAGLGPRQQTTWPRRISLTYQLQMRSISPNSLIGITSPMRDFGPFHRKEGRTQSAQVAALQVSSGEIWGGTPKNGGMVPTVQAYPGLLPACRGVEFTTDIAIHPGSCPIEARWYLGLTPGVEERYDAAGESYACISADVVNKQP